MVVVRLFVHVRQTHKWCRLDLHILQGCLVSILNLWPAASHSVLPACSFPESLPPNAATFTAKVALLPHEGGP